MLCTGLGMLEVRSLLARRCRMLGMTAPVRRHLYSLVCLTIVAGASPGAATAQPTRSPSLIVLDSITVQETANAVIGRMSGFAAATSGMFYITDAASSRILEIGPSGRINRTFGRRGQGPGELTRPTHITLVGTNLLVVLDGARLVAFDLRTGAAAWQRPLPRLSDGIAAINSAIVVTSLSVPRRSSLVMFMGPDDEAIPSGPFPHPYGRSAPIDGTFGLALRVAPLRGDTVLVAFHANEYVYWGSLGSNVYDSARVARLARNGAPPAVIDRASRDLQALQETAYALSAPWALAPLGRNRIAYVAADQRLLAGRLAGTLYVSVIDRTNRRTCPDARVPISDDPPGYVAFIGDTLVVAQQDEDISLNPRTIIRRYRLETSTCEWIH